MSTTKLEVQTVQEQFVSMMPEIQSRAAATFRHMDPEAREAAVAETVAMCWKNHLHCASTGKAVGASSLPHVTEKEKRVFELLAQGYGTGEMARRLNVSASRICQIRDAIGRKLRAPGLAPCPLSVL